MKRRKPKPVAFMSYARLDDKYGHITRFCEHLSHEVSVCIGEEFLIFQDRKDILWGQNGEARIKESLDEVTFLIPIITPLFFSSEACCDELQRFLEREKELGRNDLVLPVYYVDCPLLNDEEEREDNELAQAIAAHQYTDWQKLRFKPFDSQEVHEALAELAVQIRDALERVQTPETHENHQKPEKAKENEPQTRVVDPMHHGDHLTITEAIDAAYPGDRILVRPGLYHGGLAISKPLEIIGDGDPGEVVVESRSMSVLLFNTTKAKVVNLTLRHVSSLGSYSVDIAQGRLELEGCDIPGNGDGLACVAIRDGADPRLRHNRIHGANVWGVRVFKDGQGILEENDIFVKGSIGVAISAGCNPILRHNRIHDCGAGVRVFENGQGILEENNIFDNDSAGVSIARRGEPTLRRNHINKNGEVAIRVYSGGGGTIEDNDMRGNVKGAWDISDDSEPNLRRARNKE